MQIQRLEAMSRRDYCLALAATLLCSAVLGAVIGTVIARLMP